ncbi:MFS transporter [Acrocarpospora pleiomorpha]|uniref:MFS transporter n=1 Tax=Acrocarpospora pleiomorpha TaxID=90975 RepID=A0A5M3XMS2_9ACTN|nr:MFS transporter [Acrocarpospora pleiomorpha]GES19488.1 MFS transporter [Acrocarpospora pleiomorpha]
MSHTPLDSSVSAGSINARIDAMPKVGLSRAAWFALMLCFFFANYDISVLTITLPAMRDEFGLAGAELGYPITWNLVGYCVGAYLFGHIADRHGRQRGLLLTIAALGAGGLLTAFSWDVWSLTFFRFVTGCGMGAVLALCSAYIGEMAPKHQRGGYLSRLYTVGTVLLLLVGFASLPVLSAFAGGWRWLLAFGALVLLVLPLVNRRALVESPRWLVTVGRAREADQIVRDMESRVGLPPGGTGVPVEAPAEQATTADEERVPARALFKAPYLSRMLIVLGFWFIFYLAMYGYASYLPLILEGIGISTSDAVLVSVLTRAMPLISGVAAVLLVERMERRTMVVIGTLVFAAALLLISLDLGEAVATIGALFSSFGIAFMATPAYTYTAEIFPTRARGTASAIADGVGHLGGAVTPFVVLPILTTYGARPASFVMVALLLIAAGIIRLGVRTRDRALAEIAT